MNILNMEIYWARPELLWIMYAALACASLIILFRLKKTAHVVHCLHRLSLEHFSWFKKYVKAVLFLMGMMGLCVALMRPQSKSEEISVEQHGRDMLIALDVSRSMLATDLQPDRLAFAKQKIKDMVNILDAERVGLMLFSGAAFMQCPLTQDKAAFNMFLNQVDVETISSGTTAIEQAIRQAIYAFDKMPNREHKLLIVFTDGEDFSSNLRTIKEEASKRDVHIITVGVGTQEGSPIPKYDIKGRQIGHQQDDAGNVVITRMNPGILRNLAEDTGGIFINITQNDDDINRIKQFIQSFSKEHLTDKKIKQFDEQYHYPLLFSFFCFALEWLL